MLNKKEERFYKALEDVFVGAKIEGQGGFVNLLKIKSEYYNKILKIFKDDVLKKNNIITADFKEEFYEYLYSFFEKYFSESGSVYFTKTASWQNVYEKVYTDTKDVVLFWKTNMLYYVKTDMLFKNMDIFVPILNEEVEEKKHFFFDISSLEIKQNNTKENLVYTFEGFEKDSESGVYKFKVMASDRGSKTKIEEIMRNIKTSGAPILNEDIIEKAIKIFEKQSSIDFFINKNAKQFLTEQLDLYLHQIMLDSSNIFEEKRLLQLKTIKEFALKIIEFISQFENELVYIWNKPKFVLNSNYVITLDRIGDDILKKIEKAVGLADQIKEWQDLGMVDENFIFSNRSEAHKHLPIDTRYFKELELDILSQFDNLDEALDGRLIHSENYQALNTLQNRYKNKVQSIYIDPPFNTGSDFAYLDNYQDSSWLTLMSDRLKKSKILLNDKGSIFLHLDRYSNYRGRELLDEIFGSKNFINSLAWAYRSGGASDKKALPYKYDTLLFYAKNRDAFKLDPITERQYSENSFMGSKKDDKNRYYTDTLMRDVFEGEIYDPKREEIFNVRKVLNLSDEFYSFSKSQKPEGLIHLLKSMIKYEESSLIMDFFAGIGATTAVAHKLGKKYIGIEMGEHFNTFYNDIVRLKLSDFNQKDLHKRYSVINKYETDKAIIANVKKVGLLGRMKEVFACNGRHEPCGITKTTNWRGGGFLKYYGIEQYEDTLRKMSYKDNAPEDIFNIEKPYSGYIFLSDDKLIDGVVKGDDLSTLDFESLYKNIDFPETISHLYGLPIKQITKDKVVLDNEGNDVTINYNYKSMKNEEKIEFLRMLKPYIWWGQ